MKIKKSTILTLILIGIVLYLQAPIWLNSSKQEGIELSPASYRVFQKQGQGSVTFPTAGNSMVIFWASWCRPCKFEMDRLKTAVEEGSIPKGKIFAINPFEPSLVAEKYVQRTDYPFIFIDALDVARKLNIQATPSTLLLEKNKIISLKTGVSIIGIWRAQSFLSE